MIVVRYAKSDPGRGADRSRLIEQHKAHIRNTKLRILLSGPSASQPDGGANAAILIAEVDTLEQFEEFSASDPFVAAGVYESVEIVEWRPSFGNLLDALHSR
ncbi:YciI family protein [Agrobacterium larrymoorei]|uniref:YciI family protein n=1 Tax=Agrobacterium larrymoorei TaxID=160699 RepID=UPI001573251E|nr:YciI family protein [Agrobacterium larrymoorei]NTJ43769.1 YciI family protein [Agrobacterium larrymoorei]